MAKIIFEHTTVSYPVFNATSRSISSKALQLATGGFLDSAASKHVTVKALQDVSFQLSDGDRLGVLGHNGSGKSTLLRTIAGVYQPSAGKVDVSGKIGSLIDIGLGINPEATGRENILIRGLLLGLTKKEIQARVDEIIEFSNLGEFIELPVRTYSSGMHLRLAFAVSTAIRPEILLMDEWLSVGDEQFTEQAQKRMSSLVNSTKILVIASHSKETILGNCNKVLILEHGKVVSFGDVDAQIQRYFN
jgi:lipopolysaccharide transport system ATP-binding protein